MWNMQPLRTYVWQLDLEIRSDIVESFQALGFTRNCVCGGLCRHCKADGKLFDWNDVDDVVNKVCEDNWLQTVAYMAKLVHLHIYSVQNYQIHLVSKHLRHLVYCLAN